VGALDRILAAPKIAVTDAVHIKVQHPRRACGKEGLFPAASGGVKAARVPHRARSWARLASN